MSDIASLRARLGEISKQSDAIRTAAEALGRSLNDEERAKIDALSNEFEQVQADIARLEKIDQQRAAAGAGSGASAASGPSAAPRPRPSPARPPVGDVDPAGVKRAESILLALGIIVGIFAVLSLIGGDYFSLVIQAGISILTFLVGYKALRDGNINTARTFSLVMAWVYAGLQILGLILVLSITGGAVGGLFWVIWLIGWLFAWGYYYAYQCVTPKR
ncbi:MAG: hypothetical protein R3F55_11555 [Alphaproteobacteria bacterium]